MKTLTRLSTLAVMMLAVTNLFAQDSVVEPTDPRVVRTSVDTVDASETTAPTELEVGRDSTDASELRKDLQDARKAIEQRLAQLDSLIKAGPQHRAIGNFKRAKNATLHYDSISKDAVVQILNRDTTILAGSVDENVDEKSKEHGLVVPITSVALFVREGTIETYQVHLANGLIYEGHTPISMYILNREGGRAKLRCGQLPDTWFTLSEVVAYYPKVDQRYIVPGDVVVELEKDVLEKSVTVDEGLGYLIDYRVYTDMLALLGEESNGLVQTEASAKFYYNLLSLAPGFQMFEYVQPTFRYSKFDSEFNALHIQDPVQPYRLDMLRLNQLSFLDLGLRMNLLKMNIFLTTVTINGGLNYSFSRVMSPDSVTTTVNMLSYWLEERIQILRLRNFGLNIGVGLMWQHLYDPDQNYYPEVAERDPYLRTDFEIFYHPSNSASGKVFLRLRHLRDVWDNAFPQLQLGYSATLKLK